jgi:hypothetical protein
MESEQMLGHTTFEEKNLVLSIAGWPKYAPQSRDFVTGKAAE